MMTPAHLRAQQRYRLTDGGRIDRNQPLYFRFDGRPMMGFAGDTLASALLANGVDIVGRSFKYGRPRGIMTAGVEEPNAIVQIGASESTQTPNVRATEQMLYEGLHSHPVNGWPGVEFDVMEWVGRLGGALMTPGFYYKTFMWPKTQWRTYEHFIRKAAGLGRSSTERDADCYEHLYQHADVLVVGAGPAGLAAAWRAAQSGARVLLADERAEPGGALLYSTDTIDGMPAMQWVEQIMADLQASPQVTVLSHATVNGYHDHNFLTISERCTDHAARDVPGTVQDRATVRQRLHKVRAKAVILATGAHERPLVYANNDVPGCMVASSLSHYIHRFAVIPGERLVVVTCNDSAYQAAIDWHDAGQTVKAIVDTRVRPEGTLYEQVTDRGIRVIAGSAVIEARGRRRVEAAAVAPVNMSAGHTTGAVEYISCDTIASSGGWSPVVHLSCHTGIKPVWSQEVIGFLPGQPRDPCWFAGAVNGCQTLEQALSSGFTVAAEALTAVGYARPDQNTVAPWAVGSANQTACAPMAAFLLPHTRPISRAPKQFVDLQNDVTAAGIEMSTREGFESIEHVKRYTALGFGTDQGKTGNVNGMAIVAKALGQRLEDTGTTVFRPNYSPVSFGVVAGAHTGELFDPKRFTPMHEWHINAGAEFENVGQWKRPWYYPQAGESMAETIAREQLATRHEVGILDASTLGKIDIQGRDAREFLGRVYTNAWAKLQVGHCRYGLMCGEDGMVMDDGVTACLADQHFHMTTTTGGAAHVLSWLELYHQD